jgi:hypothetical protein
MACTHTAVMAVLAELDVAFPTEQRVAAFGLAARYLDRSCAAISCRSTARRDGPSVDPELMIGMLLIGCCLGIRSERRLCEEMHLNLAYRWFCRLGLHGRVSV